MGGFGGHGGGGGASTSAGAGGAELPDSFTVTGIVTDGTDPVGGAIVMQAGGTEHFLTGSDGGFSLTLTRDIPGVVTIVATKQGYRTRGEEFRELPEGPITLPLRFVTPLDNTSYTYGQPGVGDLDADNSTALCGHCHTTFVKQWRGSAHEHAAKSREVQDLFAGTALSTQDEVQCTAVGGIWRPGVLPGSPGTTTNKCYLGPGVLPSLNTGCDAVTSCDLPDHSSPPAQFGDCANCHAPGMDGPLGGRSLHEATGVAYDAGVHCDFCHKIADVDLSKPAGVAGRLAILRPVDRLHPEDPSSPLLQVMFGPLLDVPNVFMGGSLQPKFKSAELCAGCHQYDQPALVPGTELAPRFSAGLPVHSTYTEWLGGPFAQSNVVCQDCHMPPDDTGLLSTLDVTTIENADTAFGFVRPSDQIRQHTFRGPLHGEPRLIEKALTLSLATSIDAGGLVVTPTVANVAAGHAIPTGEPMRSLALVVFADACGDNLALLSGPTLAQDAGSWASTVSIEAAGGTTLPWPSATPAWVGKRLIVRRATGAFDDYDGQGIFASGAGLSPAEKGVPGFVYIADTTITAANGGQVTLGESVAVEAGDELLVVDPAPGQFIDGAPSLALAATPGWWFAKSVVDATGTPQPHFLGTDLAFDTRLGPGKVFSRTLTFQPPTSPCASASVRVALLYRQYLWREGQLRGWSVVDHLVHAETSSVPLP